MNPTAMKHACLKMIASLVNFPGNILFGLWDERHFLPGEQWPQLFLGAAFALAVYALALVGWLLTLPGKALMMPARLMDHHLGK